MLRIRRSPTSCRTCQDPSAASAAPEFSRRIMVFEKYMRQPSSRSPQRPRELSPGFQSLSLPKLLRQMDVRIFSLRSRRQNRAWGGAQRNPRNVMRAHQAREAGGSHWSNLDDDEMVNNEKLPPASRASMINLRRTWGSAALHPRLYSAARYRGLRYNTRIS